jgi:hypothetical protein
MQCNKYLHQLILVAMCFIAISISTPSACADEVNDLIETILDASPAARAGAESYASESAKHAPPQKTQTKKQHKVAVAKPKIPLLQIPEEDLLEVSSKFPKDFIGKYIYGPVTLHDFQFYEDDDSALIGFTAKNWRGFYLETRDPLIIEKFSRLSRGIQFTIPRDFPLRIVGKPGLSYILNMPFEKFQP